VLLAFTVLLSGCGAGSLTPRSGLASLSLTDATSNSAGLLKPIRDPSLIRVGSTYFLFVTDHPAWTGSLPILCSADAASWKQCGSVFPSVPSWITRKLPGVVNLWAPDISFFNGVFHVYYTASLAYTENTLVGLATNVTLDPADPRYRWVDRGSVLESHTGDDINVLDPNVLVDLEGRVWLSFGSYWGGIAQRELDPSTGLLRDPASAPLFRLAARPDVPEHPIEGSSQLFHNGFYFLFVSIDFCCRPVLSQNDYKMAVGRSSSPHGPFLALDGKPMLQGGSTVILGGDTTHWMGVGGGTVYNDPRSDTTEIVFHAQAVSGNGDASLWLKKVRWVDDWPVLD
jgi:arabinan endo-1,5-alpha-L-arabinosidase